jgi:hypothetical protein
MHKALVEVTVPNKSNFGEFFNLLPKDLRRLFFITFIATSNQAINTFKQLNRTF